MCNDRKRICCKVLKLMMSVFVKLSRSSGLYHYSWFFQHLQIGGYQHFHLPSTLSIVYCVLKFKNVRWTYPTSIHFLSPLTLISRYLWYPVNAKIYLLFIMRLDSVSHLSSFPVCNRQRDSNRNNNRKLRNWLLMALKQTIIRYVFRQ